MRILTKWKVGRTEDGYGEPGLILLDGDMNRTLSIRKDETGHIVFREECDGYFHATMTPDEARLALHEALAWIDDPDA